jgi:hypothetical protein
MNIQFQASSNIYKFTQELFSTKEALKDVYGWAADLVITEIDVDSSDYILRDVPEELKSSFSWKAYEAGHHAGEEEVACILRGFVDDFLPGILAYGARMSAAK